MVSNWLSDQLAIDVCYLGYLLYQTIVKGLFSYGSMVSLLSATSHLKNSLQNLAQLIPAFRQNSFYVDKIREFLSLEREILSGDLDAAATPFIDLEVREATFGYDKVAIARTFYRNCSIIILDEPSSALDPISEYYLNEAMMKAAEHKTVIFISHRLSAAKMADRIYMLENGHIIEQGSHEELMGKNGKYALMYSVQAEKYAGPLPQTLGTAPG